MRIADVSTLLVDGSWRNWVFVRVETDRGDVGYGECTVEGREHAVAGAVADMRRRVVGCDADRIRRVVDLLTREGYWTSGPVISSAVAGIEMALWDLLGKRLDVPLHVLLGGALRDRIEVYSNAWYFGAATPDEFAARAAAVVRTGYRALKFDPFDGLGPTPLPAELAVAADRVAAVRDAVGPHVRILVEGHGRFDGPSAVAAGEAVAPFAPAFFEEPVPACSPRVLRRIAAAIPVPVAAGERVYSAADCGELARDGGIAVLQPDVVHVGGVIALLEAAAAANAAGVPVAPHNASGPLATAATLQVAAVVPNLFVQEMFAPEDAPWKDAVARPAVAVQDGTVAVPDGPGLGVALDELECGLHPFEPRDLRMFDEESILRHPVDRRALEERSDG